MCLVEVLAEGIQATEKDVKEVSASRTRRFEAHLKIILLHLDNIIGNDPPLDASSDPYASFSRFWRHSVTF